MSPNPNHPKELFGYKVEGLLGEGGMSKVYKIRDEDFDRALALKVSKNMSKKSLMRFVLEGKLTGQLQHPVIPPIYSLASEDGKSCHYTMKQIQGVTLKEVLNGIRQKDVKLTEKYSRRHLLSIFVIICQAVAYAHTRGVIHRDIKPENIMLSDFGEIYLIDWGLAKAFGKNLYKSEGEDIIDEESAPPSMKLLGSSIANTLNLSHEEVTRFIQTDNILEKIEKSQSPTISTENKKSDNECDTSNITTHEDQTIISNIESSADGTMEGTIFGTPLYMAPEQARGNIDAHDHRSDTYALGVILWDILLGSHMRTQLLKLEKFKMIKKVIEGWRPNLDSNSKELRLEPTLKNILLKATESDQEKRYQKASDIADNLQIFLDGNRKWNLIHEEDFSSLPDQDTLPLKWNVLAGKWGIRDGAITPLTGGNGVVHLDKQIQGDIRVEIEGYVSHNVNSELSLFLSAPNSNNSQYYEKGYCFQYGANYMEHSKIARDGLDIAFAPNIAPVQGKVHKVVGEILDGIIRFEIDGKEIIHQRDLLPLTGDRIGLYSWSTGSHIKNIRIYSAGTPKTIGYLAIPDALFNEKEYTMALAEYKRFNDSHPGTQEADEAIYKSIQCLMALTKYDECEPLIDLLKKTPLLPLAWVASSFLLNKNDAMIQEELDLLLEAINQTKLFHEGLEDLSLRIQLKASDFQKQFEFNASILLLEKLSEATWASVSIRSYALSIICEILLNQGKYQQIISLSVKATEMLGEFSVDKKVLLYTSIAFGHLGQFKKSREILNRHYKSNFNVATFSGQSNLLYMGDNNTFRNDLLVLQQRFKDDDFSQAFIYQNICESFMIENNFDKAQEICEEWLQRVPHIDHLVNPKIILSNILAFKGEYKEAKKNIKLVPKSEDKISSITSHLAFALIQQCRPKKAIDGIYKEIKNYPNNRRIESNLLLHIAHIYREAKDYTQAEEIYHNILNNYSDFKKACSSALSGLGRIEIQNKRYDKALDYFHPILKEFPDIPNPTASLWIGLIEQSLGQKDKAIEIWKNFNCTELFFCRWWLICFQNKPGDWFKDEQGVSINPAEAIKRSLNIYRYLFQEMLDFKGSFDNDWKKYTSGKNNLDTWKELKDFHDKMPKN
ncbi:MAG: hypothetical protein COA79_17365 [Planctomycetota bacterium]|nr:MAG: hypothetical protein COA79_17365 [Planctomycetota bacterium]